MLILGKKTFGLLIVGMALSSCGFTFSRSSSSLGSASSASTGLSLSTGSSASTGSSSSGSSSSSISTSQPDDAALVNSPEYLAFWNCESDLRMSLTFTARALADISYYGARENDSTFFDVYFPAAFSLSLNGTTYNYEEVGVRMKGNTSRKAFCDSDGTITRTAHFKVSFKATFSDESYDLDDEVKTYKKDWTGDPSGLALRKNRTLFGMEKIDLKYVPRNFDPYCVSQEVYVYDSFRKEGIMAPRANLAAMEITDVVSSLSYVVEAVECIDKVFLKRYYNKAESKGDLYKCVYGPKGPADLSRDGTVERVEDANGNNVGARIASGRIGVEDNINGYHPSYDLSTNDDEGNSGTFSSMVNYINSIWDLVYNSGTTSLLEATLDVAEFLRFSAVSQLFGNPDDQRYNANNYYIYFLPSSGKAVYIPYDWDWSLGLDWSDDHGMASKTALDESKLTNNSPNVYYATFFVSGSTAYSKVSYRNAYLSAIASALADGLLDFSSYAALSGKMKYATDGEYSLVSSFMAAHKAVLS